MCRWTRTSGSTRRGDVDDLGVRLLWVTDRRRDHRVRSPEPAEPRLHRPDGVDRVVARSAASGEAHHTDHAARRGQGLHALEAGLQRQVVEDGDAQDRVEALVEGVGHDVPVDEADVRQALDAPRRLGQARRVLIDAHDLSGARRQVPQEEPLTAPDVEGDAARSWQRAQQDGQVVDVVVPVPVDEVRHFDMVASRATSTSRTRWSGQALPPRRSRSAWASRSTARTMRS